MKKYLIFGILSFLSSVSFAQLKNGPERYPDDPSARGEYDFLRLRDPATNEIPEFIAGKEFEFAAKLPKHDPFGGKSSTLQNFDWQPLGPTNQSGRIQAIGIDILNENNMLAGTASGGVWRTIDGGQSWLKVTLPNDEQTISAIVQDTRPGKETTWYYSTGELLSTTGRRLTSDIRTHSWGNGIYKSTDNGATWDPILSTITTSKYTSLVNFTGIWNLALDRKNISQDIIYAACYGGIMRSSDGGSTWTNVLGGDSAKCFNSEIVIGSGGTLYAALGSAYDGTVTPHQGIWRSNDGINWTKISNGLLPSLLRRTRLAVSESTDTILYCLTETPQNWKTADQDFVTEHTLLKYVFLSGNGSGFGGKWESRICPFDMNQNIYNNSLGGYCLTLAVHPADPDQVLVGGNDLYYSADGFSSNWVEIGGYYTGSGQPPQYPLHPDIHVALFSHSDPSTIFVGHDGGISSTNDYVDGEAVWTDFDNGLSSAQVYHTAMDHGTPGSNFIISGIQDNNTYETMSDNPSDPWYAIFGGDGMTAAICNGGELFFASYQGANIACFDSSNGITYHGQLPPPPSSSSANFFTNYILEPNNTNELYLAYGDEVWRYNNLFNLLTDFTGGSYLNADWTEIPFARSTLRPEQAFVTAFGFAKNIPDRLFYGSNIGKVYEVDNASTSSPTQKNISGLGFPAGGFVAGIEVDPLNANEIIVVFSNYHVQSLFRTTDGGASWDSIGGNLEELPDGAGSGPSVRCAKILHTAAGTTYYVGTSVGLYSTTKINGMQTVWTQESPTVIGNLIVENLEARQSDGKVIVSTQGGGVFTNMASSGVSGAAATSSEFISVEQNYPNPFRSRSKIRFTLGKDAFVTVELYNAIGEKLSVLTSSQFSSGTHTIELAAKDYSEGNYFLRFSDGKNVSTKMITIIK